MEIGMAPRGGVYSIEESPPPAEINMFHHKVATFHTTDFTSPPGGGASSIE